MILRVSGSDPGALIFLWRRERKYLIIGNMKTAIIDDSSVDRIVLRRLLKAYAVTHAVEFEISEYESADLFLQSGDEPEVIFLDIYMNGISGIDLARKMREENRTYFRSLVFVSGSNEFASEAFELRADYYLKKPVERGSLDKCMDRILANLHSDEKIDIVCDRKCLSIYVRDIVRMEKESRKIMIHTVNGQLETYMPLSRLLEMLPVSQFARITRFEAVSLLHTSGINKDVLLLDNGEKRTISEKMLSEVTEAYHDHKMRA